MINSKISYKFVFWFKNEKIASRHIIRDLAHTFELFLHKAISLRSLNNANIDVSFKNLFYGKTVNAFKSYSSL